MEKRLFLFFVVFLLSSCTYDQKIDALNSKLNNVQNATLQNKNYIKFMKPQISAINRKIILINKKLNELENATSSVSKKNERTIVEAEINNSTQANLLAKIPSAKKIFNTKTKDISKINTNSVNNKNSYKPTNNNDNLNAKLAIPSKEAQDAYNNALSCYMSRDFKDAKGKFLDFIKNFPDTKLEQNAFFWVGNSYYNLNDYENALKYFNICLNNFPRKSTSQGGKTDACYFMLYKTYKAMGNNKNAYKDLMELKQYYPVNPYFEFRGVER